MEANRININFENYEGKGLEAFLNNLNQNKTMKHYCRETNHIGYTQVWEGKPTEFIEVILEWLFLDEDYLKLDSAANPSNIVLWVANEWIDWPNLRITGTYRPTS